MAFQARRSTTLGCTCVTVAAIQRRTTTLYMAGALLKARKADQEEREKIGAKEKPTRTWAWNASYHRKEIKRCKESIEYHERKLAAANLKARSEKASVALPQHQGN
jgi:hypothetical protein